MQSSHHSHCDPPNPTDHPCTLSPLHCSHSKFQSAVGNGLLRLLSWCCYSWRNGAKCRLRCLGLLGRWSGRCTVVCSQFCPRFQPRFDFSWMLVSLESQVESLTLKAMVFRCKGLWEVIRPLWFCFASGRMFLGGSRASCERMESGMFCVRK